MFSSNQTTHLSKLLSYILRRKPSAYEIVLDENGYPSFDELISKLNTHNENISFKILQHIIDTYNKKRFAFNDDLSISKQHFKCKQDKIQFCIFNKMI